MSTQITKEEKIKRQITYGKTPSLIKKRELK